MFHDSALQEAKSPFNILVCRVDQIDRTNIGDSLHTCRLVIAYSHVTCRDNVVPDDMARQAHKVWLRTGKDKY